MGRVHERLWGMEGGTPRTQRMDLTEYLITTKTMPCTPCPLAPPTHRLLQPLPPVSSPGILCFSCCVSAVPLAASCKPGGNAWRRGGWLACT